MPGTQNIRYFPYGEKEMDYLKKRDAKLGQVIDIVGHIKRRVYPDVFRALLWTIIGQQISGKAQDSIWASFERKFAPIVPQKIASLSPENLRECGIPFRKAEYMLGASEAFASGLLDPKELAKMGDYCLKEALTALRGVGDWTAEMLLIFAYGRIDVLSFADLAIQRGMRMLYGHKKISLSLFEDYKLRYRPYGTIASFYFWEVAGGLPGYADPATSVKKTAAKKNRG